MPGVGIGISPFINPYSFGGTNPDYFINDFPGFLVGYSLRQLNPNADNCIRVRRSSDDSELDVGFVYDTTSNQYLIDTDTLEAFCGAGDGFIKTWYDQSGNDNHLTQTTSTKQPAIVSSGVAYSFLGKTMIYWDGTDDYLTLTNQVSQTQPFSCFQKSKRLNGVSISPVLSSSVAGAPFALMEYSDNKYYTRGSIDTFVSTAADISVSVKVLASVCGSGAQVWNAHDQLTGSSFALGGVGDFIDFGRRESQYSNGYCDEFIFYQSDKTTSVLEILANMQGNGAVVELPVNSTNGYLVITAGQSNSTPRSPITGNLPSYLQGLQSDTWNHYKQSDSLTDNGFWNRLYEGRNAFTEGGIVDYYGYQSSMGYKLLNTYGKAAYFVSDGVGGTALDDSVVPSWYPTHVGEYYDKMIAHVQQAISQASNVGSLTPVFIWNQGEYEAGDAGLAANYEASLLTLFAAIRSDLSLPNLKIIIVKLGSDVIFSQKSTIRTAQQNVADAQADTYIYESPYPISSDGQHYNPIITSYGGVQARQLIGEELADIIKDF